MANSFSLQVFKVIIDIVDIIKEDLKQFKRGKYTKKYVNLLVKLKKTNGFIRFEL